MKGTVYLEQPHEFEKPKGTSYAGVCHLLRAIYGLKRTPWEWYLTLVDHLRSLGYKNIKHDHIVLVQQNDIIIAIYLNNLLLLGLDLAEIGQLKKPLNDKFCIKDM